MRIHALLLALARHLGAYLELGAAAVAEYRSAWARRAVLVLVAAMTCIAGCATLWLAGLVALWDTSWRLTYVVASALVLLVVSGTTLLFAMAQRSTGPVAGVLKSELRKDVELFEQWKSTI